MAQVAFAQDWRPELKVTEIPAPSRIAPHSIAMSGEVVIDDLERASGRLVLLHDPAGNPAWEGDYRCVSFARAQVDPEMVTDPLLAEVGWSWLLEALERQLAQFTAPAGTVTSSASRSFGGISAEPALAEIEIRASWTPLLSEPKAITGHVQAWAELLCQAAGIPPLPDGVVPLVTRRSELWTR